MLSWQSFVMDIGWFESIESDYAVFQLYQDSTFNLIYSCQTVITKNHVY